MSLADLLSTPFYTGIPTSSNVPFSMPVAINGREYLIDLRLYERQYLPAQRQAIDSTGEPGDQTLNPLGLWPRSQSDFRLGAGQEYRDDLEAVPSRFKSSRGIDVWQPHAACLLPGTEQKRSSANTNLSLLAAEGRMVLSDGQSVLHTDDPSIATPVWTAYTGTPASTALSMTTDGYYLYVAFGANGIYRGTVAGAALAVFSATPSDFVVYSNGRLLSGNANVLNEIDNAGVATALFTHDSAGFIWNHAATSPSALYVGGIQGDRSETYYVTVDPSDGSLTTPVFTTSLPEGEYVTALKFYAGSFVMGTSLGVRLASATDQNRSLVYGTLIETGAPVYSFAGYAEFVWFTWSDYDGEVTGLGRLDLSRFTATLTPAFASDVMAVAQGDALSVVMYGGDPYFAVSADGVYGPEFDGAAKVLVESGTLDTGVMTFGTALPKIHAAVRYTFDPLKGSIASVLVDSRGVSTEIVTQTLEGSTSNATAGLVGRVSSPESSIVFTLNRSGDDPTLGPCLRRWTLLALPRPDRTEIIRVPVVLSERVEFRGVPRRFDTAAEYNEMRLLAKDRTLVTYQEGLQSSVVYVDDVSMKPQEWADGYRWLEGIMFVTLITVDY